MRGVLANLQAILIQGVQAIVQQATYVRNLDPADHHHPTVFQRKYRLEHSRR